MAIPDLRNVAFKYGALWPRLDAHAEIADDEVTIIAQQQIARADVRVKHTPLRRSSSHQSDKSRSLMLDKGLKCGYVGADLLCVCERVCACMLGCTCMFIFVSLRLICVKFSCLSLKHVREPVLAQHFDCMPYLSHAIDGLGKLVHVEDDVNEAERFRAEISRRAHLSATHMR